MSAAATGHRGIDTRREGTSEVDFRLGPAYSLCRWARPVGSGPGDPPSTGVPGSRFSRRSVCGGILLHSGPRPAAHAYASGSQSSGSSPRGLMFVWQRGSWGASPMDRDLVVFVATHVYAASVSAVRSLAHEYGAFFVDTEQLRNIGRGDLDQIGRWEDLSARGVAVRIERRVAFAQRASTMVGADEDEQATLAVITHDAAGGAVTLPWLRRHLTSVVAGVRQGGRLPPEMPRAPDRRAQQRAGFSAAVGGPPRPVRRPSPA